MTGPVADALDGTELVNTATVTVSEPEVKPADNTSTARVTVGPQTQVESGGQRRTTLRLRKSADRRVAAAGQQVRYTLTVRAGRNAARDVRLCDTLPRGLRLVRTKGATVRDGRPCWRWSRIRARARRTVTLVAQVRPGARPSLRNRAGVRASNAATRNTTATIRTVPVGPPQFTG